MSNLFLFVFYGFLLLFYLVVNPKRLKIYDHLHIANLIEDSFKVDFMRLVKIFLVFMHHKFNHRSKSYFDLVRQLIR